MMLGNKLVTCFDLCVDHCCTVHKNIAVSAYRHTHRPIETIPHCLTAALQMHCSVGPVPEVRVQRVMLPDDVNSGKDSSTQVRACASKLGELRSCSE